MTAGSGAAGELADPEGAVPVGLAGLVGLAVDEAPAPADAAPEGAGAALPERAAAGDAGEEAAGPAAGLPLVQAVSDSTATDTSAATRGRGPPARTREKDRGRVIGPFNVAARPAARAAGQPFPRGPPLAVVDLDPQPTTQRRPDRVEHHLHGQPAPHVDRDRAAVADGVRELPELVAGFDVAGLPVPVRFPLAGVPQARAAAAGIAAADLLGRHPGRRARPGGPTPRPARPAGRR